MTSLAVSRKPARWIALARILAEGAMVEAQGRAVGLCSRCCGVSAAGGAGRTTNGIDFLVRLAVARYLPMLALQLACALLL